MKRSTKTLADVGEHAFLKSLRAALSKRRPPRPSPFGPGDDAALVVLPPPRPTRGSALSPRGAIVCTDMVVEDVDFRRRWASFADVGHKAAAINLSDLAAMGSAPRALFASIAAAPTELADNIMALLMQIDACAQTYGARLCGGDLSKTSGPLVVSVTAVGEAPTRLLRRHCANEGDVVCVTGPLGAARAGLALLESDELGALANAAVARKLLRAQRRPTPHVHAGLWLAATPGITAGCDVSDGLLADAAHLPNAGLGVVLDAQRLPLAAGVQSVAQWVDERARRESPAICRASRSERGLRWALCGGEDFVLAVCVQAGALHAVLAAGRARGVYLTPVGRITRGPGVRVWPSPPSGEGPYDHFA